MEIRACLEASMVDYTPLLNFCATYNDSPNAGWRACLEIRLHASSIAVTSEYTP